MGERIGAQVQGQLEYSGLKPNTGKLITVQTPNFTQGQLEAISKIGIGSALITGGTMYLPEGAPAIALGIPILSEGLTLGAVEFIFKCDTSNIPSEWEVFGKAVNGIYKNRR